MKTNTAFRVLLGRLAALLLPVVFLPVTGMGMELEQLPHEADAFEGIGGSVAGRFALWPSLAPGETQRKRGRYFFDEKRKVWRMGNVESPEVVLIKPRTPRSDTLVLGVPGGGYIHQNMSSFRNNLRPVLESGRWLAVLHHRMPRRKGRPIYAAPQEDGIRAVRILRSLAPRFGYSPEKIGGIGFSAGGNLVALLAASSQDRVYPRVDGLDDISPHLNFAVPVYPAYVLDDAPTGTNINRGVDAKILPHFKFDAKTPPMFLVHGDDDPFSAMASVQIYTELRRRRIPAQMFIYARAAHGLGSGKNVRGWKASVMDWMGVMGF